MTTGGGCGLAMAGGCDLGMVGGGRDIVTSDIVDVWSVV